MGDFNLVKVDDPKALGNVAVSLIDKIEHACGWVMTPKGVWEDHVKAKETFIKEIETNPKLTSFEKAAFISDAKRLIKRYKNQNDIFQLALKQLDDKAKPENVDDSWFSHFFDEAGNISQEDIKIIWAKLLATECNNPGEVSKLTITTLSNMDFRSSKEFNTVCNCSLDIGRYPIAFVDWEDTAFYESLGLTFYELNELEGHGLIKFNSINSFFLDTDRMVCSYLSQQVEVNSERHQIFQGNVMLTSVGQTIC